MNLKEMVMGGKTVKFVYYLAGELWYSTSEGFRFPVPVSEAGTAKFLAEDKAILFMRYIRAHLKAIEDGRAESNAVEEQAQTA